jgi:4-hydroxy-4-methyl-2-oxoglutarate aldolase
MLTKEQLDELRQFDTPTISNAIELFNIRPRTEGFTGPEIKSVVRCDQPVIGYACTAKISAQKTPSTEQKALRFSFYEHMKNTPSPSIAVMQDLDEKPVGSFWGEVNIAIAKSLGCVGTVTNGGLRDLDVTEELPFGYFASCVLVSRANIHVEDYNCPARVGGLTVNPGDLLHADKHGVILIPAEIAPRLAEACRITQFAEEPVIQGCRRRMSEGKTPEIAEIKEWMDEMNRRQKL